MAKIRAYVVEPPGSANCPRGLFTRTYTLRWPDGHTETRTFNGNQIDNGEASIALNAIITGTGVQPIGAVDSGGCINTSQLDSAHPGTVSDQRQFGSISELTAYAAASGETVKQFSSGAEALAYTFGTDAAASCAATPGGCPAAGTQLQWSGGNSQATTPVIGSTGATSGVDKPGVSQSGPTYQEGGAVSFDLGAFIKSKTGTLLIAVVILWALLRNWGK